LFLGTPDDHLWMIISEVSGDSDQVFVVNFSSWSRRHDQSCIVNAGDHPFVHHRTIENYPEAELTSVGKLRRLLSVGALELRQPLSEALLNRIRAGAGVSTRLPNEHRRLLVEQGLLEE
jgi:hypothetical protein